jgi:colicin import membrane protein
MRFSLSGLRQRKRRCLRVRLKRRKEHERIDKEIADRQHAAWDKQMEESRKRKADHAAAAAELLKKARADKEAKEKARKEKEEEERKKKGGKGQEA